MKNSLTHRGRVGDYVRHALPRALAEREIRWSRSLEWDQEAVGMLEMRDQIPEPSLWPLSLGAAPATDPKYIAADRSQRHGNGSWL
jgi:hypothetical protein